MKVGRTWNLPLRMTQLRKSRKSTRLHSFVYCRSKSEAIELESMLHGVARSGAMYRGDWHEVHPGVVDFFLLQGEWLRG